MIHAAVVLLALASVALAADKKPKPEPKNYDNFITLARSCDDVWSEALPLIARRGFMPDGSDRAGGIMRLRYTRGETGWLNADKDVRALTRARPGGYYGFRIAAASLLLSRQGEGCMVMLQIEYHGYRNTFSGKQWTVLESNNSMESSILAGLLGKE